MPAYYRLRCMGCDTTISLSPEQVDQSAVAPGEEVATEAYVCDTAGCETPAWAVSAIEQAQVW